MNYAEHPYENQMGSHCQANSYPSPYHPPSPYRPHPVSPPAHYGGHVPSTGQTGAPPPRSPQQQHPPYANGPPSQNQPPSMSPYSQQQYNPMGQGDMMYPRHMYPNSRAKPGGWGVTPDGNGGGFPPRPPMMGSPPPPMRSTPGPPHGYRPAVAGPPQSQSPSWAQSPRTTPSPLAAHARSPVQPFSPPPTPALTPQLKPSSPAVTQQVGGPSDPLQSLQKMVMLDSDAAEVVERYDVPHSEVDHRYGGTPSGLPPQSSPAQHGYVQGVEGTSSPGSPYPTYYNLDQNRLCTPPRSIYGNICGDLGSYQMAPVNGEVMTEERTGPGGYQPPMVNGGQTVAGPFQSAASRDNLMRMDVQFPPQTMAAMSAGGGFVPENGNTMPGSCLGDVDTEAPTSAPPQPAVAKPTWPSPQLMAVPPKEDPTKRRRSSDSVLCGGPPRPEKGGQRRPRGGGASGRGRRRSTTSLPECPTFSDGAGSSDAVMPAQPQSTPQCDAPGGEQNVGVGAVDSTASVGNANSAVTVASGESGVDVAKPVSVTPADTAPPKKKRGRPFGSKNKKKEDGLPPAKTKRGGASRKKEATVPAPPSGPPAMQAPPAQTASRAPRVLAGPYVHVEGTRERPVSSKIVNTVCRLEEEGKKKKGAEQGAQGGARPRQHPRRKLVGGHTSTLSPNYDAFTRDPTWVCALCRKGSHFGGLGDLYGPYGVGDDPGGSSTAVQAGTSGEGGACRGRGRRRRSEAETVIVRGAKKAKQRRPSDSSGAEDRTAGVANCQMLTAASVVDGEAAVRELWVHEDCAVWTQGVYLVGHRVRGLEEAVREAQDLCCSKCKFVGATLACVMRGCAEKFHYLCAVERGCQLESENFSIRCPKHKKPSTSCRDRQVTKSDCHRH